MQERLGRMRERLRSMRNRLLGRGSLSYYSPRLSPRGRSTHSRSTRRSTADSSPGRVPNNPPTLPRVTVSRTSSHSTRGPVDEFVVTSRSSSLKNSKSTQPTEPSVAEEPSPSPAPTTGEPSSGGCVQNLGGDPSPLLIGPLPLLDSTSQGGTPPQPPTHAFGPQSNMKSPRDLAPGCNAPVRAEEAASEPSPLRSHPVEYSRQWSN
ncbi:hypothetical protein VTK56DRAFT_780 [Thermocarpiscus australiensis]